MSKFQISVTCASGVESVTKNELIKLGYEAPAINGAFTFEGDENAVARLNMFLRTADRVVLMSAGEIIKDDIPQNVLQEV